MKLAEKTCFAEIEPLKCFQFIILFKFNDYYKDEFNMKSLSLLSFLSV